MAIPQPLIQSRVCVVEGDPAVRDSLATLITVSGYEVTTFATGAAFLQAVEQYPVECVVCEAELPDASGINVYLTLKQRRPACRFALLQSRPDPAAASAARRLGVDAVFHKPFVHGRLKEFVKSR